MEKEASEANEDNTLYGNTSWEQEKRGRWISISLQSGWIRHYYHISNDVASGQALAGGFHCTKQRQENTKHIRKRVRHLCDVRRELVVYLEVRGFGC